jgi:hypothetical protein
MIIVKIIIITIIIIVIIIVIIIERSSRSRRQCRRYLACFVVVFFLGGGGAWGHVPRFGWHREFLVAEDPPAELFARISAQDFLDQYVQLRSVFIAVLLGGIEGQACWHVESVTVRLVTGAISQVPVHNVSLVGCLASSWGTDKSLQLGLPSVIGKTVVVKPSGLQAVVLEFSKRMPEDRLYKLLMTQPYTSCRHIWHVLRLYHRLVMAGATSEALAESVGSMLTRATSVPGHKVERRPVVFLVQGGPLHFPKHAPQCLVDLRPGISARPGCTRNRIFGGCKRGGVVG